jgi:metal-responsive CopG/Arc/MetJ family transcriptional regulator
MEHCNREIVLTIRVDHCLAEMLKDMPNRSEFIRVAMRHALERSVPDLRRHGCSCRHSIGQ